MEHMIENERKKAREEMDKKDDELQILLAYKGKIIEEVEKKDSDLSSLQLQQEQSKGEIANLKTEI